MPEREERKRNQTRRGDRVRRELRRVARGVGNRLMLAGEVEPEGYDPKAPPHTEVCAFFGDGPERLYQLDQWLPVLEVLDRELSVTLVVRHAGSYDALRHRTALPVLLSPRYEALMTLYGRARYRCVLYVNNGLANFQSLAYQPAAHVHVNHGESDKLSMVSNQAKAYDRVFVAGQAAVERHRAALAWFDLDHLVPVGRPQLDVLPDPLAPVPGRRTVTYAPTWEGEDEANNYTSVDRYAEQVVAAALSLPGTRVVYKPHPRVVTSPDAGVRAGHRAVVTAIERAQAADPAAGHVVQLGGDVLSVLQTTDLLVTDVSSVGLDFLYLRPDQPLVVCDRRADGSLLEDSPAAAAAHVVDPSTVGSLAADLAALLEHDPRAEARREVRRHYFGDNPPGSSLPRFLNAVRETVDEHDAALAQLRRRR